MKERVLLFLLAAVLFCYSLIGRGLYNLGKEHQRTADIATMCRIE